MQSLQKQKEYRPKVKNHASKRVSTEEDGRLETYFKKSIDRRWKKHEETRIDRDRNMLESHASKRVSA